MKPGAILSLHELEGRAARLLPRSLAEYVAGGAEDGLSVRANREAFERLRFVPRVLQATGSRATDSALWGEPWRAPFGIAPMGAAALMARDADCVLARAAAAEGIPFILSGSSLTPMERVIEAHPRAWFQLYPADAPDPNRVLLERAAAAGFGTLVVTVDVPVAGRREADLRNGYTSPLRLGPRMLLDFAARPQWLVRHLLPTFANRGMPHFENYPEGRTPMISRTATRSHRRDGFDWIQLALLRDRWPGRLVLKGVLAPQDVQRAWAAGVDGVIVSNHGGRQLDGAISPVDVLPAMVPTAPDRVLMCDGGIRRGNDVLKAIGRGAQMTWVGRPLLQAAVVGGEACVRHAIGLLRDEMMRSMAMLGLTRPQDAAQVLWQPPGPEKLA